MNITLTKWGNSIGIRLPAFIAKRLKLHNGSKVHIELTDNKVIIEPLPISNREMIKQALKDFDANDIEKCEMVELDSEVWCG